mgnify:FL=1
MTTPTTPPLALFDLDHTLLDGDGDDLWCRFLLRHGQLDASVQARNEQMGADYRAGRVSVEDFSNFYAGLLAGRTPAQWAPWQARFLAEEIQHRLPEAARALVASHREAGHTLVLTTASNSVIAERTAAELGFTRWIATELTLAHGVFTGEVQGFPNMREGKLRRLRRWLSDEGLPASALSSAWFYSDSINDLPLLDKVHEPVATNPDDRLRAIATERNWQVLELFQ